LDRNWEEEEESFYPILLALLPRRRESLVKLRNCIPEFDQAAVRGNLLSRERRKSGAITLLPPEVEIEAWIPFLVRQA
jgi:hypothetical protein